MLTDTQRIIRHISIYGKSFDDACLALYCKLYIFNAWTRALSLGVRVLLKPVLLNEPVIAVVFIY